MPLALTDMLVVGILARARCSTFQSDKIFASTGRQVPKRQEEHLDDTLSPGVAFPLIRHFALNDLSPDGGQLVEVITSSGTTRRRGCE